MYLSKHDIQGTKTTLKNRHKCNKVDKKKMWDAFDETNNDEQENLICLYEKQNTQQRDNCTLCSSQLLVGEDRFLTCSNKKCGVMYRDTLDQSAEWRYYGADDSGSKDPTRCGMPINPLLKKSSYGCKVMCPSKSSYEMRKIRRYTEWQSMPYNEKMRYDEGQRISILADHGGIPKIIIDEAMRLHKRLSEAKSFRGLNRDGIIAATIYVSAMINNNPRTAKEIATIFKLDTTSATKGCRNAVTILNELEHEMDNSDKINLPFLSSDPCSTR